MTKLARFRSSFREYCKIVVAVVVSIFVIFIVDVVVVAAVFVFVVSVVGPASRSSFSHLTFLLSSSFSHHLFSLLPSLPIYEQFGTRSGQLLATLSAKRRP